MRKYTFPTRRRAAELGFTMVEIMVAVAVVAVIAAYGVPNLSSFLRKVKVNAASGAVLSALQQGRSEAVKSNQGVLVCSANTARTGCATTSITDWGTNGWLVCYDLNADSICDASTASLPNPIMVSDPVPTGTATVVGPAAPIRFLPTGALASGSATQTVTVTGAWTGATALNITVAATGLIKGARL